MVFLHEFLGLSSIKGRLPTFLYFIIMVLVPGAKPEVLRSELVC